MTKKNCFVYIVTNKPYGTLYIGVTSNLARRLHEHKEGLFEGFTKRYNLKQLVYCEVYPEITRAIEREKELKKWKRDWKKRLIETLNPSWRDLNEELQN